MLCGMALPVDEEESLAAKFAALFPHLDERQRRLAMGAEARVLGHGGIKVVARAAGVSAVTVSRGVAELEAGGEPLRRVRHSPAWPPRCWPERMMPVRRHRRRLRG